MNNKIEALKLIADAVDFQKMAMDGVKELLSEYTIWIDCDPENPRLHLFEGIQEFADELGQEIKVESRKDQYDRWGFTYNGIEVFQLVKKEVADDLSDQ